MQRNPENPRRTDASSGDSGPAWILLPREHGAWGMVLAPFMAAAILGGAWTLDLLAGLAAILLAFIIREPLTVLARQKWVWRSPNPATASAKRALAWHLPVLLSIGAYLWVSLPQIPLLALSAVGVLMTVVAVWMTVRNRSRENVPTSVEGVRAAV